ncbi:hypothetical protein H6P81_006504 [Aristolochia fimbriata]|uniref:Glutaredoxin domain-containing protein n=1 Tax=Aristolochia fimbriata TaxID=158543 RepID=A0AAV7EXH4_ARIFI|nr:hypothetical protein H6P81_006504 [Aristolochia fimbriata]
MWPRWGKSPRRSPSPSQSFTFTSFKDVQSLVDDKSTPNPENPNVKKASSIFHRVRIAATALRAWNSLPTHADPAAVGGPDQEKKIVVYFTSLRVVRKTFEDCRIVRSILKGFRVSIDERDLSMDASFLEELQSILGRHKKLTLPRVFIGGKYVGGADEIRQMHESGELKKIIEGFPTEKGGVCESCGGIRFVLCYACSGSHKCYLEKGGFRSCVICNENGLLRCPSCCS